MSASPSDAVVGASLPDTRIALGVPAGACEKRGAISRYLTPRGRCGVLAGSARVALPLLFVSTGLFAGLSVAGIAQLAGHEPNDAVMTILASSVVLGLLVLVPVWVMASVQRLHDLGRSGWWLPLTLLPFAGPALSLYITLAPGRREPNRFGDWQAPTTFEKVVGLVSLGSLLLMLVACGVLVFSGALDGI